MALSTCHEQLFEISEAKCAASAYDHGNEIGSKFAKGIRWSLEQMAVVARVASHM